MKKYFTIKELINLIDEPNKSGCLKLLKENIQLFKTVQGSTHNHQAWPGGYYDHVEEIMNIAFVLYDTLNSLRPLPFSKSDLLLVVFLHDLEKPWKYELNDNGELHCKPGMNSKQEHQNFRMNKLSEYGIVLTDEHENGIKYAEGEIHDYSSKERRMSPLACVAHMSDVASARLWFDYPNNNDDTWKV